MFTMYLLSMQELKGNIRVFCRVRPLLSDDTVSAETNVMSFPTSTEAQGRGIDLIQNGVHLFPMHSTRKSLFFPLVFILIYWISNFVLFKDKNNHSHSTKFSCLRLHKKMFLLRYPNLYRVLLTVIRWDIFNFCALLQITSKSCKKNQYSVSILSYVSVGGFWLTGATFEK